MPDSLVESEKLQFASEPPSRYDYEPSNPENIKRYNAIDYTEVKIGMASEYSETLIRALLPAILGGRRRPTTLQFVNHNGWKHRDDDSGMLRGVLLRDKDGTVLLYAYGIGLNDSEHQGVRQFIFETLGISKEDQVLVERSNWPQINYSVVITLP